MKMKRKMLIPRVIESFYPVMSGPANQASRISQELEKKGIRSPVLTSNSGAKKRPLRESMGGVSVVRFPIIFRFMKYFYTPGIKKTLSAMDSAVICGHSYRSYQTEQAFKIARRKGRPFVMHNHGSLMGYKAFVTGWRRLPYILYDIFHKRIALDADAVVVNTRQEYDEVLKFGVDKKKIHIIPVGIDTEDFRPAKKNWKELRLLFVGRISRDRNLEPVIQAVKLLSDRGIDVKLTIVGGSVKRSDAETGDYMTELKALVKRLDISKQVTFTGPKYGKARNRYYQNSDIFIYTSLWENFGQTILEAAAAGLPLICTRVGVALDLIEQGNTGYLVGPDKPGEIAKAVAALKEKTKRAAMGKTLIRKVKSGFRWDDTIRQYIQLYRLLAK